MNQPSQNSPIKAPPPKSRQPQKTENKNIFKAMSTAQKLLLLCLLPIIGFSMLPILIVLFIGLLPTITVLITDYKNTNKLMIVGCFNMAGVFIYIFNVIQKFNFHSALSIAGDIFNLIIMLGSAAVGVVLYSEMPKFFLSYSKTASEKRLKQIDEKLAKIEEEWGGRALKPKESSKPQPSKAKGPNKAPANAAPPQIAAQPK